VHRVHCLYSVAGITGVEIDQHRGSGPTRTGMTPGEFQRRAGGPVPIDRLERAYRAAAAQLPATVADHLADRAELSGAPATSTFERPRLALFRLPYGGLVLYFGFDFAGGARALTEILSATAERWSDLVIDGVPLPEFGRLLLPGVELPDDLGIASDVHHVVVVDPEQLPVFRRPEAGANPPVEEHPGVRTTEPPPDADGRLIEQVLFRSTTPLRAGQAAVAYPPTANRAPRKPDGPEPVRHVARASARGVRRLGAVVSGPADRQPGPTASVPSRGLRRTRRDRARSRTDGQAAQVLRGVAGAPARLSAQLGRLEIELAFGVEAHLDIQFVLGSPMLSDYHRSAAGLMGLPQGSVATSTLVASASRAVAVRRDVVRAAERSLDEVRVRRVTSMAAALSVIAVLSGVFFGFFGASAAPVAKDQPPFLSATYTAFYLAFAALLLLLVGIFALVRRRYPLGGDHEELSAWGGPDT
jgi:hypothetical protein